MTLERGAQLAHYRLEERIGAGGMGVVWRATDLVLRRRVAVKVLLPGRLPGDTERARLLREATTAASLSHPNICTIHEVRGVPGLPGEQEPPFIVMELIEGEGLDALLAREAPLPLPRLGELALQIAEGLAHAHTRGVVHRDLKPGNVMVTAEGRVKLLDFGLALPAKRRAAESLSTSQAATLPPGLSGGEGEIVGTVAYMSPEQVRGDPLDERSDLFSLGAVLYEMASGRAAFEADSALEAFARILESDPANLAMRRADLPSRLTEVIDACLSKDREDRRILAADVADALRSVLEEAPATTESGARPETSRGIATRVAVFPFWFRGGDGFAYLSEGMVDLMTPMLDGAGDLRSIDSHLILCCGGWQPGEGQDVGSAREAARRLGADLVVLGSIVEAGGTLQIEAALWPTAVGRPALARASIRGPVAGVFESVEQLGAALLAGRAGTVSPLTTTAARTTASFAALKAYLEGEREMRAMRRTEASEAYGRAVALDPSFGLAWYRLGVAALWSRQPERADEAARSAMAHSGHLGQRERRLLEAFDTLMQGRSEQAESLYRAIVSAWPEEAEAWYQLGELATHLGPLRGRPLSLAREVWQRLLRLDPAHLPALVHLAGIAASEGSVEEIGGLRRRLSRMGPAGDAALWIEAMEAFARKDEAAISRSLARMRHEGDHAVVWTVRWVAGYLGDLEGALRVAATLADEMRPAPVRSHAHINLAHLHLALGRLSRCGEELDQAEALDRCESLIFRGFVTAIPGIPWPRADVERVRARLQSWDVPSSASAGSEPLWLYPHRGIQPLLRDYLLGLLAAADGDRPESERLAARVAGFPVARTAGSLAADLSLGIRASLARARGDWDEAMTHLSRIRSETNFFLSLWSPFYALAAERFLRAQACEKLGRVDEAARWFGSFSTNTVFELVYLARSHARRSRLLRALGQPAAAERLESALGPLLAGADDAMASLVRDEGNSA